MKNLKFKTITIFLLLFSLFLVRDTLAYTVIAVEEETIFYGATDGPHVKEKGLYKYYFQIDEKKNTVKRVKIVALGNNAPILLKKGDIIPDDTIYQIILPQQKSILTGKKTIHAIGQPGVRSTELLTITDSYVMFSKSTGDYMVISRSKIIETSDIK